MGLENDIYISYCHYAATGEGMTLMIVLGYSKEHTETVFTDKFNKYFRIGMQTCKISEMPEDDKYILSYLPTPVVDCMKINLPPMLVNFTCSFISI